MRFGLKWLWPEPVDHPVHDPVHPVHVDPPAKIQSVDRMVHDPVHPVQAQIELPETDWTIRSTRSMCIDQDGCALVSRFLAWVADQSIGGDTTSERAWAMYGEFCELIDAAPLTRRDFLCQLKLHCACVRARVLEKGVIRKLRIYSLPRRLHGNRVAA